MVKLFVTGPARVACLALLLAGSTVLAQNTPPQAVTKVQPLQVNPAAPPAEASQQATPPKPADQATQPQGPPPKAEISSMEFDAGDINKGDVIKHDFIVTNKGVGTLEIQRVQPGCGCTVTEFDKKVEPGKTGKITASVQTASFNGPIHKTIMVATNDPALSNFQLSIKANIKAVLNVTPGEYQQMGLVFKGQAVEKEFTLKAEDGVPFDITQVQADDPTLKYDLKMAPDKKSATFKVTLPEDHPVGPVSGGFVLSTTHPKVPSIKLSIFGTIREPMTVYPTEVVYSGLNKSWVDAHPDDQSLNKAITVSYEMAPELQIQSVTSSLPFLEATSETLAANQRYSVKLHIKPPVKEGDFSGTVTIVTNKKTLTIPVRGKIF